MLLMCVSVVCGQAPTTAEKPPEKTTSSATPEKKSQEAASSAKEKKAEKPPLPFQIQLLDTKIRFEANGDSLKEVHTIVTIVNILGVQQFGRISFDYN